MGMKLAGISIDRLPQDFQSVVNRNMSSAELCEFCLYAEEEKGFLSLERREVILVTNYKLIKFTQQSHRNIETGIAMGLTAIGLERIQAVKIHGRDVWIDYGQRLIDNDGRVMDDLVEWYKIPFGNDESLKIKFHDILTKTVADAFTRVRTPAVHIHQGSIPDIGDQLLKLAELRKSGAISNDEYEAAKRKLLS